MPEIEPKTLEEILQEYFECKKPFLKKPVIYGYCFGEPDYEYFTRAGGKAYNKLTRLIESLEAIGAIDSAHEIIARLDSMVREE